MVETVQGEAKGSIRNAGPLAVFFAIRVRRPLEMAVIQSEANLMKFEELKKRLQALI